MDAFLTEKKLAARTGELNQLRYRNLQPVSNVEWTDSGQQPGERPPQNAEWQPVLQGTHWEGKLWYYWLRMNVTIPYSWHHPVGLFDFGTNNAGNTAGFESLLYLNGEPFQGVDANHTEVVFPKELAGKTILLEFRLWSGLGGYQPDAIIEHRLRRADIAQLDLPADQLYYMGTAILDTVQQLGKNDPVRQDLIAALDRTVSAVDWSVPGTDAFYKAIARAVPELTGYCREYRKHTTSAQPVTVTGIGHTHIDVAWLWRLRHTREKAARSFSTALHLMDLYPEFVFLQTQPQLYDFIKHDYPDLYKRIRAAVAAGTWEPGGAMWLEADCNIPSGESLVRQLLAGTAFFQKEFGAECRYLWLPDVFGYSGALPQILRKAGISTFVTTKISWNQYNRMPHDTFYWKGIDGTEILTHFITTPDPSCSEGDFYYTYNGTISAETVFGIWNAYRDKAVNRNLLLAYGYGDGGGGVTRDMIEMRRALAQIPGTPDVKTGRADQYFKELEQTVHEQKATVPVWDGELYLELHRGTYTSQAQIKRLNRKLELLLRRAEIAGVAAVLAGKGNYPVKKLHEAWKILLRNQFHDIIPGSAIHEVYTDAAEEFKTAGKLARQALDSSLDALSGSTQADGQGFLLDTLGRKRTAPVLLPEHCAESCWECDGIPLLSQKTDTGLYVELPQNGKTAKRNAFGPGIRILRRIARLESLTEQTPFSISDHTIRTPYYTLELNGNGQISSLFDREADRQILKPGQNGNVLQVFEDRPAGRHEAWDIDIYYRNKQEEITALQSRSVEENGPLLLTLRSAWKYRSSTVTQRMTLYAHSRRIDFCTEVDWHESRRLLKVAFPVLIRNTEATYDIQFGNIRRPTHWNTSWDIARFEVPAQQWADFSETGYGVSLLNDCKYGYDIHDSVMRLTLIKSAKVPDPTADQGRHRFTYALLPHRGSWQEGRTADEAADLNDPPVFHTGKPDAVCSPLFTLSSDTVCIDAVKQSESGSAIVLRLHEYTGGRTPLSIQAGFPVRSWMECNLLEEPSGTAVTGSDTLETNISPYEIRTFLIEPELPPA